MLVALCLSLCFASASATGKDATVQLEPYQGIPTGWQALKAANPYQEIELTIAVKQQNLNQLEETLLKVSDPSDAKNFGNHLSLAEVNALVAPSSETVSRVNAWLDGVVNSTRHSNGNSDFITTTMNIKDAERLLGVTYSVFAHVSTKHQVIRTNQAYTVPTTLAADIDFIGPTIRFPGTLPAPGKSLKSHSGATAITPDVLRKLYNVGDVKAAASTKNIVACASFLGQFFEPSDLQTFFKEFDSSLSGSVPAVVGPNTPTKPGVEAMLDIEYIMAMGKGVPAQFWSTAGEQPGNKENEPFLVWLSAVASTSDVDMPRTFSVSYGDNEPGVNLAYATRVNAEFQKAGVRGISILFASGDGGVSGGQHEQCTKFVATYPAGSPWVTAVGGTTLSKTSTEVVASLSSGGFSNYWPRPAFQEKAVAGYLAQGSSLPDFPDASLFNHTGAGIPDVSAQAEDVEIIIHGRKGGVAGTSCAAPIFSGVVALLNELRISKGKSSLGFLNQIIYANPDAFNDITSGSNPGCNTKGFPAAKGWDPVTGFGSPNYEKLAAVVTALP